MLKDKINDIVESIEMNKDFLHHNHKIFKCMKGDQLSVLKESFNKVRSNDAKNDKVDMAISINYIQKIVDTLSTIYNFDVERKANLNQDLVDYYIKEIDVDNAMQMANEFYNGMKSVLVELYQNKKKELKIRAIPSDRFFVYSDDPIEPNCPTVYIKMLGTCSSLKTKKQIVNRYIAYDDESWVEFDSEGGIRKEGENIFGVAPFVYINKDSFDLIPIANKDMLQCVLQINSILTDANVASYYQSFPIRILINSDIEGDVALNPNTVLKLDQKPGSTNAPDFRSVASTLSTADAVALATNILTEVYKTFGITASGADTNAESGVALALKSSDIIDNRKGQISYFKKAETELWWKLSVVHNSIIKRNDLFPGMPKQMFDDKFEVEISFELPSTEVQQVKEMNDKSNSTTDKPATEDTKKTEEV